MPDPDLLLAALSPEDRATVLRWLGMLGMEPDDLECVPPLRQLVETVACLELMADMPDHLPRHEAWEEAGAALGLNGPSVLRRWYRWQEAAVRRFVREDEDAA